jgi:hypothetical protein
MKDILIGVSFLFAFYSTTPVRNYIPSLSYTWPMAKKKQKSMNRNIVIITIAVVLFVIVMFLMNAAGALNVRTFGFSNPYAIYSPSPTPDLGFGRDPRPRTAYGPSCRVNNYTSCSCYSRPSIFRDEEELSTISGRVCYVQSAPDGFQKCVCERHGF